MRKSEIPFRRDIKTIEAHRPPTEHECVYGNGATHYKTFPVELWIDKNGLPKCWIKCPVDGLRYYR